MVALSACYRRKAYHQVAQPQSARSVIHGIGDIFSRHLETVEFRRVQQIRMEYCEP